MDSSVVRMFAGCQQRAEAGDIGQVLANQLVGETTVRQLKLRLIGAIGAHVANRRRRSLAFRDPAHLLNVEFAVEQILVHPRAAFQEQRVIVGRRGVVTERTRHLLGGAQGAQVVDRAERIRTVELDVVGVVLDAFHHAVAIGVPPAGNPCERETFLDVRP